jgi:predicted ribosome quality control (RQC) complex YloA/Tae2 family protein
MTLDGLTLYTCVNELNTKLSGAKVDKVFQPLKEEVVLGIRTKSESLRLLISAGAGECRINLTDYPKKNPQKPPTFCMFLRKHLQSARITSFEQVGLERIVNIYFDSKDELGIAKKLVLVCEFMGKYSNIILINEEGKILDSSRHVPFGMSSVRQVLPGMAYELPPSDKYNPFLVSTDTFLELTHNIGNKPIEKFLVSTFQGVSSFTAHELTKLYLKDEFNDLSRGDKIRFVDNCLAFFDRINNFDCNFTVQYDKDGMPKFFSVVPYVTSVYKSHKTYDTANRMIDEYYQSKHSAQGFKRQKTDLSRRINKALAKHYKKFRIQTESIESSKKAEKFKLNGDLIMANIYRLKRGMEDITLEDYNTGKPVKIVMDKKLTPSVNAQKFYKRYNKLKTAMSINAKNILTTKDEIDFLESVLVSLDICETMDELKEVKYELIKASYISVKSGTKSAKPTQDASKPHEFLSSDGFKIYAGKNNRQNDLLTIKTADQNDMWLHTQKIPGCHVIIKTGGKDIPEMTIFEAATIAAFYSKAKTSNKVPVDYTLRKNVRKPNGSKPGFVIYETYNTIIVDPDEEIKNKLKKISDKEV